MKRDYPMTPQQLQDAIQNTIRVFNDYALDKKMPSPTTYRIQAGSYFYVYQFFITPGGTQLEVTGGKFGQMTADEALNSVNQFFGRLDQIINGQIALTPEVVNRDVYKSGSGALSVIYILRWVAAIAAIVIAMMILMR